MGQSPLRQGARMTNAPTLKGKVAVVTGASTGIGREVTVALSMSGATVCIIGRPRRRS